MTKRKNSREKREHKRFKTYDDVSVFFDFYGDAIGQITDISEGGLGLIYTGHKNWSDNLNTVDITTADYLFSIKNLRVRVIWESNVTNVDSSLTVGTKRGGIQFRYLKEDQKLRLIDFIEVQISKDKYLKK